MTGPSLIEISDKEYHDPKCRRVSASRLKILADKSPMHLEHSLENPIAPTPAMKLGTIIHSAVLEDKEYVRGPEGNKRLKKTKELYAELEEEHGDLLLDPKTYDQVVGIKDSVFSNPTASAMIGSAQKSNGIEQSAYWTELSYDLECKARFDVLPDAESLYGRAVVDLKTCQSSSPKDFSRSFQNFHYYLQGAMYLMGCAEVADEILKARDEFIIIAVEKTQPYGVSLFEMTDDYHDFGIDKAFELMGIWRECLDSGNWPGYPQTVQDLELPPWLR